MKCLEKYRKAQLETEDKVFARPRQRTLTNSNTCLSTRQPDIGFGATYCSRREQARRAVQHFGRVTRQLFTNVAYKPPATW